MGSFVVDTHALVWYLEGNLRLGTDARKALSDPSSVLYIPVIVLAEICWIVEHGKSAIPTVSSLMNDIDADSRIILVPLDRATLDKSLALTNISEMHDRQIVASALILADTEPGVALISKDEVIASSRTIPLVW